MEPKKSSTPQSEQFVEACAAGDLSKLRSIDLTTIHNRSIKSTSLNEAAKRGHLEIFEFLLSISPEIGIDSFTAYYAAWGGLEMYKLLHCKYPSIISWSFGEMGDIVHSAIRFHNIDLLEYVLENDGDPGRTSDCCRYVNTFVPIENAALAASPEYARLLITYGATLENTVALEIACQLGRQRMVEYLLSVGADVNYIRGPTDPNFDTRQTYGGPLHKAAKFGHVGTLKLLLKHGADMNLKDTAGKTALDEAQGANQSEVVEQIRLHGATLEAWLS